MDSTDNFVVIRKKENGYYWASLQAQYWLKNNNPYPDKLFTDGPFNSYTEAIENAKKELPCIKYGFKDDRKKINDTINQLKDTIRGNINTINQLKETILVFCNLIDYIVKQEGLDDLGQLAIGTELTKKLLCIKCQAYNSIKENN
jgi:hypothetical protein